MKYRGIDGFPGYLVTDTGMVLSSKTLKPMKPYPDQDGYPCLKLYSGDGNRKAFRVHRLVLEAFEGPRPVEHDCIRHLDGNPDNPRLCNLQYGTHQENYDDMVEHGTAYWCLKV